MVRVKQGCQGHGCRKPIYRKSLCVKHHCKHHNIQPTEEMLILVTCKVEGCDKMVRIKGYCQNHYESSRHAHTLKGICPEPGCNTRLYKGNEKCYKHRRRELRK